MSDAKPPFAPCGLCGGSGWASRVDASGVSIGPCACRGGRVFEPADFAWFMHTGAANAPDGLGRLIMGILKDGRQVFGQAFTAPELLALAKPGSGKSPLDVMLYCLVSELTRLNLRVGELEKKLSEKTP